MATVNTPLGPLRGSFYQTKRGEDIFSFQGVPYGKPPVGDLRFKDPVPIEPWSEVRSAQEPPPMAPCMPPADGRDVPPFSGVFSEDCLYLNIFTPKPPNPNLKLPVMVYIHGGGFTYGTGNQSFYGPDYLVPKGVILVNINYRIGPFGFLSLQTPEYPGNAGLKDQTLGLKWIQANIAAFGGDPNNVTLFGESAGSASVQYHTLSPLSRGLFQRAIAMSGSALNRWAYSRNPTQSALSLAKRLGSQGDDVKSAIAVLSKASTEEILTKSLGIYDEVEGDWESELFLRFPFVPTAEPPGLPNAFLTKTPQQAIEDGDYADVPYITGVCADEMIFCLPKPDYVPPWENKVFQMMLPKELGLPLDSPKMKVAADKLKGFYFPNGSTQKEWIKAGSALLITHGVYKTVEAHVKDPRRKSPSYLYVFNASRENSFIKRFGGVQNVEGVCHADDLEYIFTMPAMGVQPIDPGTEDDEVKENITTLWTDFAKGLKLSSRWPQVDADGNFLYIQIDGKITPKTGFFAEEMKFWDEIYSFLRE